jgi:hypothetical protein
VSLWTSDVRGSTTTGDLLLLTISGDFVKILAKMITAPVITPTAIAKRRNGGSHCVTL